MSKKYLIKNQLIQGAGCFVAGTKIYTPLGYRNIEDIKIGDSVFCFDKDLSIKISTVENVFAHYNEKTIDIFFKYKKIRTTPNHPFLNQNNEFIEIGNFTTDDLIVDRFGKKIKIDNIEIIDDNYTVYNFTVAKYSTYIVEDILVHNKGGGSPPPPPPPPDPHEPKEEPEGIFYGGNKKLSRTETEVVDLISEGPIDGLVSGVWKNFGTIGNVGWNKVVFSKYAGGNNGNLKSVFWNKVSVIDDNGNFNYSQTNFAGYNGTQTSASQLTTNIPNYTFPDIPYASRTTNIGESLRYSPPNSQDFVKSYTLKSKYVNKIIVAIKIDVLYDQQNNPMVDRTHKGGPYYQSDTIGDIRDHTINYSFVIKKMVKYPDGTQTTTNVIKRNETSNGKITAGFIQRFDFDIAPFYNADLETESLVGWEIEIKRTSPESSKVNIRDVASVHSITEVFAERYIYPKVAIFRSLFTAEYFSQVPDRAYDVKLLKVKIPSNYDPIKKTYDGDWDGTFKNNLSWTDNPAWCYYDLLTNNRYGLGKYIKSENIDKWQIYEIARYCDTIVSNGYGGTEPRFTCNTIINDFSDAYTLLNDFASIFRGLSYYANGLVYVTSDMPQEPISMFNNSNVENGDFIYSSSAKKVRNNVAIVRYNDVNNSFKPGVEYVEDPEGIRKYGIRKLEMSAFGCTSRGQAYRLGKWALISEQLETETVAFTVGLDSLFLKPGDIVKIQDRNRTVDRLGGRVLSIGTNNNVHNFVLDQPYADLLKYLQNTNLSTFRFSILTPTSRATGNMYSDYVNEFQKTELQTGAFSINNLSIASGFHPDPNKKITNLTCNKLFDANNYSLNTGTIWTIERLGDTNSYNIVPETEFYRIISITEGEDSKYQINAMEYNPSKYGAIESGLSLVEAPVPELPTTLDAGFPDGITLTPGTSTLDISVVIGPQQQPYTERASSYWRVFMKKGSDFNSSDLNEEGFTNSQGDSIFIPSADFMVANINVEGHPNTTTITAQIDENNQTYYFRVYGINILGYISNGFTAGNVLYYNNDLADYSSFLTLKDFRVSGPNTPTYTVAAEDTNLFSGETLSLNFKIVNKYPEIINYRMSDLQFRFDFVTGTTWNTDYIVSSLITGIASTTQEGTHTISKSSDGTNTGFAFLSGIATDVLWIGVDLRTGSGGKWCSQTSLAADRYTRESGYLKALFQNELPDFSTTGASVAGVPTEEYKFKSYVNADNNIFITVEGYQTKYPDINSFIVFFTENGSGLLSKANINNYLEASRDSLSNSWVKQLELQKIQCRNAWSNGYDIYSTVDPFTANAGTIRNGSIRLIPMDTFQNNIIDYSNYQRVYNGGEGDVGFRFPNGNNVPQGEVLNNKKFIDQLIMMNNATHDYPAEINASLMDFFTRDEALLMSGDLLKQVVLLKNDQDITGIKNFKSRPTVNGSGVLLQGELAAGGGGSGVNIRDEGTLVGATQYLNFKGAGVVAALNGTNVDITIPGDAISTDRPLFVTGNQNVSGIKTFLSGILSTTGITGTNLVYNTGNQTIKGTKTFENIIASGIISSGGVTGNNLIYLTGKQYIEGEKTFAYLYSDSLVYNTGNQTVNGIKNFTSGINSPNIVYNSGNQNISGIKNFLNRPTFSGTGLLLSGEDLGPNIKLSNILQKTGNQELNGFLNIKSGLSIENIIYSNGLIVSGNITGENIVYDTGNQTISGVKAFSSRPTVNGTGVMLSGEAIPGLDADKIVYTTGNQSIAGIKNFTTSILSNNLVYNTGDQTINGDKTFNGNIFGANLVYTSDINQTISGNKTFTQRPSVNGVGVVLGNESFLVYASGGDQNITGTKNFKTRPTVNGIGVILEGEALQSSGLVYTTGNQDITGIKTFLSRPTYNGVQFMLDGELAPNVPIQNIVWRTGTQDISGLKTFKNNITAPNLVYTTNANQTINGSKTFTSAISAPNLVYTNNDQQIFGIKTFAQRPTVNGSGILLEGEIFQNINFTDFVLRSGDQTISGIKSFINELNAPNIVRNTGNENILGIKNFINRPTINGSGIVLENELFPNINPDQIVYTTGDQTISGVKTFPNVTVFLNGITASNLVYDTGAQSIAGIKRFTAKTIHTAELVAPNIVYNTGNQIISGIKDFQSRPTVSGIGVILSGEIYPDIIPDKIMFITGNQTISGVKTFSGTAIFSNAIIAPNIVYNTGNQTISGIKIFDERPTLSGSGFLLQGEIYPDINFNELVLTTGDQTIVGLKTFSSGIISNVGITGTNLVYNTGNQTISGVKNFSDGILSTNIVYSNGTSQNILGIKTFNSRTIFLNGITAGNIVYNTGNQNIDGTKNFLYRPTVNGSGVVLEGELFPNVNPNQIVYTTGNQTISGIKNFSGELYAPNIIYKTGDHNLSGTISFSKRPNVNGTGILIAGDIYPQLNLNDIVYATGDQVVNGFKYFTIRPEVKIDENNESKVALVSEVISLTGENQNVTGIKNFINRPTVNNSGILISGEDLKYRPTVNGSGVLLFGESSPIPIQIQYQNNIIGNAASLNFSGQEFDVSIAGGIATIQVTGIQNTVRTTGNETIEGLKTFSNGIISSVGITGTNLVYNTGNQTIGGLKTFSNGIISSVGVTGSNLVYNTGNQTIGGLKTFSNGIVSSVGVTGSNLVYNTGNQIINGVKNFISKPTVNENPIFVYGDNVIDIQDEGTVIGGINTINFVGNGVTTSVNNGIASVTINGGGGDGGGNYVSLVGDETINGFKTFAARTTFSSIFSNGGITGTNLVYNTGDQQIGGIKTFSDGINLNSSALEDAVPKTVNVDNTNFNIISGYNTKIIFASSPAAITGTIIGDNPIGFNATIIQYGPGPIQITGGPGITINSYENKYQTAGQYAAVSIIQKSNNDYIIFGNLV